MAIEEDTIVGPDRDGPSEYMADIGKGVLLANAKLKLLEEFVGSTSSDARQTIMDELATVIEALRELARDQHSSRAEVLARLVTSLETTESKLMVSLAASHKKTNDGITGLGQAVDSAEKNLGKSVSEAESHLVNQLAEHRLKMVNTINETRDLLQRMGKEHESAMTKLLDGLETRTKNVMRSIEQSVVHRSEMLSAGQDVVRKWLLWLTIAVVLLSGTSVALLVAILMRK